MQEYTDAHRYFLQSLMQRGVVDDKECRTLLENSCEISGYDRSERAINAFLTAINKRIQPFHLEIRKGVNEDDGTDVYALISITDHDINRLTVGGYFSRFEIDIFRRIVDCIVTSDEGTMSSVDALNITEELPQKNISKSDVQCLISKLLSHQWLGEREGVLFLSPRSVLELEPYLKDQHQDSVRHCGICKEMVFRGPRCVGCGVRIHGYCSLTYFRGMSDEDRKCPSCHVPMPPSDSAWGSGGQEDVGRLSKTRKRRR